jgi:hypothetical protein
LPGNFGSIKPEIMQWYNKNKPVSNKKISGAEIKSKKTDNGYIIEAKIPFSEFGEPNLFNLTKFTFSVSDSDEVDKVIARTIKEMETTNVQRPVHELKSESESKPEQQDIEIL